MSLAGVSRPASPASGSVFDSLFRNLVLRHFSRLRRGEIVLHDAGGSRTLGQPADLQTTLRVHRPAFFRRAALGGVLGVAESYLNGDWDCDDLTSLFRIFLREFRTTNPLNAGGARLAGLWHRLWHGWRANTKTGSRRNIAAHYDLGNDFYRLWLDDTLAYSSGIFATPQTPLRDASLEKFDRVCRKLDLQPGDDLLEIGTGWGGFALHAARAYGCRVTTTTISAQQAELARQRIDEAGLSDEITLLQQDYRDLSGQYDHLVSIEMIEAVGDRYLDAFLGQCSRLLRPDGSLVLQAIVMPERGYAEYLRTVDFIQRYVFPGGCLLSLARILEGAGRTTDLRFVHAEDFAPHYAETLRRWRRSFQARRDDARQLGCTEEFLRLWHYYLCYCEAAFEERSVGVLQIQFDKPECRRDPILLSQRAAGSGRRRA